MAIRAGTATDGLSRTANLLNYNAAYTISFWFNFNTPSSTFICPFCFFDSSTSYDYIGFDTGVRLYLEQATNRSGAGSAISGNARVLAVELQGVM